MAPDRTINMDMVTQVTQALQAVDRRTLTPDGSDVIIIARYLLPDGRENSCEVRDLTLEGALFRAPPPNVGTQIIAYVDNLGRLEATVESTLTDAFRVRFDLSGPRLQRMGERLRWLYGETPADPAQPRRAPRFQPAERSSKLTMPDGRTYPCEIIDISVSGAALKIDILPAIGIYVQVGRLRGRVVRHLENGIAVEFISNPQS